MTHEEEAAMVAQEEIAKMREKHSPALVGRALAIASAAANSLYPIFSLDIDAATAAWPMIKRMIEESLKVDKT